MEAATLPLDRAQRGRSDARLFGGLTWGLPGGILAGAAVVGTAALVALLMESHHERTAYALAMLPVTVLLGMHPRLTAGLLAVSLPFPISLLGGGASLNIATSDLLLALLTVVVVAEGLRRRLPGLGAGARPVALVCGAYLAWAAVLLSAHLGTSTILQTGQRLELFFFPALVGIAIALWHTEWIVVKAYLAAATAFAAMYPFVSNGNNAFGIQKNPAGQFMANALILLAAVPRLRTRAFITAVPVLVIGLLWTQSRGAVLSVLTALVVLAVVQRGPDRRRFVLMLIPLAACIAIAFLLLPEEAQQRNLDFSTASGTAAARSAQYRQQYADQAWGIIHARPGLGVGVGNFADGVSGVTTSLADPHNVLLLNAAEGGYAFAGAFVAMVAGSAVLLWRWQRVSPLAAATAAVLVATAGHGLVDVYWVRGTPVLGWLLLGVVAGSAVRRRLTAERSLP